MNAHIAHILIIEDDSLLRKALKDILQIHGYRISEAEDRVTALEILKNDPTVAVVLLDLGLPPFTYNISEGISVLKAIQADFLRVKVLVLTGMYQENAALEAIREGAFDFLAKPASPAAINSAIERALLFLQKELDLEKEGIARISINAQISDGLRSIRVEAEKHLVQHILKETGFNVYKSAKRLGIKRENMYYFLKKYGIARDNLE